MNQHLLDIESLSGARIKALLERADQLAEGDPPRQCSGTVANLFFEPSTRTRVSFQIAARRLGLEVVNIDHSASSTRKGESLEDTAQTLAAMDVETIVLRHPEEHAPLRLAAMAPGTKIQVVNAGDGCHAHPSQALLDALTLRRAGFALEGLKIVLIGDIAHSRVARSDIALFARLGAGEIRIAGPAEFMPAPGLFPEAARFDRLEPALDGVDAIVCLRIQRERIEQGGYSDGAAFHRQWGVSTERLDALSPEVRILHPGPVNRGIELAGELINDRRSLIVQQVRNGVYLRTALFEQLHAVDG